MPPLLNNNITWSHKALHLYSCFPLSKDLHQFTISSTECPLQNCATCNRQRHTHLQAAAIVPASSVVSPGLKSPACSLLCLTTWGSVAAGDHSKQRGDIPFFHQWKRTPADCKMCFAICQAVSCTQRRYGCRGFTSGCEGLSGLLVLWSSLGTVVSMLGGLSKRFISCCWLSLRLWMMLHDCCCFCKRTRTYAVSV